MTTTDLRAMTVGLALGGVLAYLGYHHIGWYHAFLDWQFQLFTHPLG
jgi:hypothetical protein